MATFTESQYRNHLAKHAPKETNMGGCLVESALHRDIEAYCKKQGWPYIHSRFDKASVVSVGAPDFAIAASNGKVFWVECKTAKSKQTPEQKGWQMMLEMNNHKFILARSMEQFLEGIK